MVLTYILINRLGNFVPCISILTEGQDFVFQSSSRNVPIFKDLSRAVEFIQRASPSGARKFLTPVIPNIPGIIWISELGEEE